MSGSPPPAGYVRVAAGRCAVVVLAGHADDARALLTEGALYDAAERDPAARPLAGRGIAYAITLPRTGIRAVVRRNRHGGLLAPLTRDLFLPPTRAPYELVVSQRLAHAGVLTPLVLMYGVEHVSMLFRRSDVVTREVPQGRDLASFMRPGERPAARAEAWRAAHALVGALGAAGARHHDLNVKNILLASAAHGALEGWVLDVDRVAFGAPRSRAVHAGNVARLARSARKWRDQRGAELDERELARFAEAVA